MKGRDWLFLALVACACAMPTLGGACVVAYIVVNERRRK